MSNKTSEYDKFILFLNEVKGSGKLAEKAGEFNYMLYKISNMLNEEILDEILIVVEESKDKQYRYTALPYLLHAIENSTLVGKLYPKIELFFNKLLHEVERTTPRHIAEHQKREKFYLLIWAIRDTQLMERKFDHLLNLAEEKNLLNIFISASLDTKIIKEKFTELLGAVERIPDDRDRSDALEKLISESKGTKLLKENFNDLSSALEHIPTDNYKRGVLSKLISTIKRTKLMNQKFSDVLSVIKNMSDDADRNMAFFELVEELKATKLLKEKFSELLTLIEHMNESELNLESLSILITAIKGTNLIEQYYTRIRNIASKLIYTKNISNFRWKKERAVSIFLKAIKGTRLRNDPFLLRDVYS